MINILNIFNWTTWLIIILVILFIFWAVYGGKEEYEFIGVKPLTTPGLFEKTSYDYEASSLLGGTLFATVKSEPVTQSLSNKGEDIVYEVLQELLQSKIERNVRPDFLKNPETGKNLEMDCYCEEYALAVEYNGIQHYKYPSAFHKSEKDFYNQVYRDRLKRKLCDESNVYLISVPYWIDAYNSYEDYLRDKNNINKINPVPRFLRKKRIYNYLYNKINEYFEIIFPQEQNGELQGDFTGWSEYSNL
jgi:hypothetical protein